MTDTTTSTTLAPPPTAAWPRVLGRVATWCAEWCLVASAALVAAAAFAQGTTSTGPSVGTTSTSTASTGAASAATASTGGPASLVLDLGGHGAPVRRLALDAGSGTLVSASDDKTAIVWRLDDLQPKRVLRVPVAAGEVGRLYGAALAPQGTLVAVAGTTAAAGGAHRIHVFDTRTGTFVRAFDARGGDIKRLAWSHDGTFIVAAYARDAAVRVFGADGSLWFEQRLPADAYGISIGRDSQIVVTGFDRRLRLYRVQNGGVQNGGVQGKPSVKPDGEITTTLNDPVSVQHSPDGRWLAVGYFSRHDEVGSQGSLRKRVIVDVYDAAQRKLERSVELRDVEQGNLMTVAWRADGRELLAGGTGYAKAGEFVLERITWPEARARSFVAAPQSILDLAALPDGRMVFASGDGSIGVVEAQGERVALRSASRIDSVLDTADLRTSADTTTLQWRSQGTVRSFDLAKRTVAGEVSGVSAPVAFDRAALMVTGAHNGITPMVNGHPVVLLPNESTRAAVVTPARDAAILASSRALRRVAADGRVVWMQPTATESRAVQVSADGRLVVALMSDGTLRWYRAADGVPLVSLLVLRDGRWILWTESGHFDAGPSAEDLVGWLVKRPGGEQADYYGASRFRDRFLRPDVIDQVLAQADLGRALALANEARVQVAQATPQEGDDLVARVREAQASVEPTSILPAALTLAKAPPPDTARDTLELEIKVFGSSAAARENALKARVDGRPVALTVLREEPLPGGETLAVVSVQLVKRAGRLQVTAESRLGHSMPVEVDYRSDAPALRERPRASLHIAAVGISRYANPVINLVQAAKDAGDFTSSLERQQGQLYERVNTRVLTDGQATRANVLEALAWLRKVTGPDDTAVLFLAGHGVLDATDTYYFLPHDMVETRLQRSAVSETQLREALAAIQGRTLFFVDTCYASRAIGKLDRRETTRLVNGLAQAERGVIVFSGSAPRQESLESTAWGNGAFTKALLEGLGGLADPQRFGFVTHVSLDGYVGPAVRSLTAGRQTPITAVPQGLPDYPVAKVAAQGSR